MRRRRRFVTARVLKFGGTSLGDAERTLEAVGIVASGWGAHSCGPFVVVVSALAGVTDALERQCDAPDPSLCRSLEERHRGVALALDLGPDGIARLDDTLEELGRLLHGLSLVGECEPRVRARILSLGEALSAAMFCGALISSGVPAEVVDPRELIVTAGGYDEARVDRETSDRRIRAVLGGFRGVAVVPGFAGATPGGSTTLLGRGGSDYTAALIGGALRAESIEIWTDVEGVMSADPSRVAGAFTQRRLSFAELAALARLGAKVVHAPGVQPARDAGVPLVVRSTRKPRGKATWITDGDEGAAEPGAVRGVTSVADVVELRLPIWGGPPGGQDPRPWIRALVERGAPPLIVSTGSGEADTAVVLRRRDAQRVREAADRAGDARGRTRWRSATEGTGARACVSVVGSGVGRCPATLARAFTALADAGIPLHAHGCDVTGSSLSVVVPAADEIRAVVALHDALLPAPVDRRPGTDARLVGAGAG